jgi:hypothetical protein
MSSTESWSLTRARGIACQHSLERTPGITPKVGVIDWQLGRDIQQGSDIDVLYHRASGVLKLICDNYNKAAEEHCAARGLKKLKFMFGDQLLHVLAVAELGNLKTLALQASSRLARESIKRKLEQKITNKYVVKRLVATIGRLVMGVKTSKSTCTPPYLFTVLV